jgi:hypothetical protein
MTNEEKLDAIYKISLENHEVLSSLRRQQYMANFLRLFYWLVILGAIGGSYYYVRPLLDTFMENRGKIESLYKNLDQFQLPEASLIQKAVDTIKTGQKP